MRQFDPRRDEALTALTHEHLTLGDPADTQPEGPADLRHWRWHLDEDGIAWALLDCEGAGTNTLSEAALTEFARLLSTLEKAAPKALVIRSAKPNGFAAGADIGDFRGMTDKATIEVKVRQGLDVLDRLAAFPAPTVALIHGFCLGGGLELALACRYRIAREDAKLGFPEVMLGLHPGLAGTWRTLRLADPVQAMTMMLTGRNLDAHRAKAAGLVDAVTAERHFATALSWAVSGKLKTSRGRSLRQRLMSLSPARALIARRMEAETAKKARKDHYPAPYALIDLWRAHGDDEAAMRREETRSFAELMAGETARNLIRVFFLRERLKGFAKTGDHGVAHIHVIGAGVMGGDIAAWCALRGFRVTLEDREMRYIAPAVKRADTLFSRRLRRPGDARAALDRLVPDPDGAGLACADLVIEAVPEDEEIKQAVYKRAEAQMRRDAILATNTSSILLETLRKGLKRPERFVGVHFFNPVASMPLVEVVTHDGLDAGVRARTLALVGAIDKLPLPVASSPGFLVNRALTPYMMEAFLAYDEGIAPERIDAAAEAFGMPMGPIELADQVGLDVALHVAETLKESLHRPLPDIPAWFSRLVEDGHLGRKSGKGIYEWKDGKPQKHKVDAGPDPALRDRLVLPLLDACVWCLREEIVEDADAVDAGIVFGTGFAPFRGGPMHYAGARGVEDVVDTLERLEAENGERFAPDAGWAALRGGG